jgi:very-short-patch-repair endonuclease
MIQEEISTSAGQKYACEVCSKEFRAITNSHLKQHGLTTKEYRAMYPQSNFGDFSRFETWRNSEENKTHLMQNTKEVYSNPEILEKKRTARTLACSHSAYLEKLSKASKRNATSDQMKQVYSTAKDRVSSRMKMSNFERWKSLFGEEEATKRLEAWSRKNKLPTSSRDTKPELLFESYLASLSITFEKQFRTCGYICDFYLPDYHVVVEIDGDYWHANPSKFSAQDLVGHKKVTAELIWQSDAKKTKTLESRGYCVIRYWASDLKHATIQSIFEDIVRASGKLEEAIDGNSLPLFGSYQAWRRTADPQQGQGGHWHPRLS